MRTLVTATVCLIITSCASTTILEREDGAFVVVANSSSESHALSGAKSDANAHCEKLNKRMVMVDQKSEYKGADKTAKTVIGAVQAMSQTGRRNQHSNTAHSGDTHNDYRVEMTFRCK